MSHGCPCTAAVLHMSIDCSLQVEVFLSADEDLALQGGGQRAFPPYMGCPCIAELVCKYDARGLFDTKTCALPKPSEHPYRSVQVGGAVSVYAVGQDYMHALPHECAPGRGNLLNCALVRCMCLAFLLRLLEVVAMP